jgi:hypothetical protein
VAIERGTPRREARGPTRLLRPAHLMQNLGVASVLMVSRTRSVVESGDWRIDVVEGALRRAHVVQYLEVEFVSVSKIASMIEREMSWLGSAKK